MKYQHIDELITLSREKQRLIESFLHLTEEQAEAIKNENYDGILNTINRKQHIIEQINLLDLNSADIIPEHDESLQLINNHTRTIMARAIAIDNENIAALKTRQADVFAKLKSAQTNKLTHTRYRGKNMGIEGILLDRKK
ncbi:MAG: hypothetical protein GXY49_04960 [Syntrophomonadaceae bacterium]|nr:hypothetical protein [Syntrophomonadaceae bacterium]